LTGTTIKADAHPAAAATTAWRAAGRFFIPALATICHGDAADQADTGQTIGRRACRAAAAPAFHRGCGRASRACAA
jgi:hypothetical protein